MTDFDAPEKFDAFVFMPAQAVKFVHAARKGHVMIYHSGLLSEDSAKYSNVRQMRQYVFLASAMELLSLRQSKVRDGWWNYYAVRTAKALTGVPARVITGAVPPEDYIALRAVQERQAAQSVVRCIRDALAISDNAAVEIRNRLIRAGLLTIGGPQEPPELTDLGLEMLT